MSRKLRKCAKCNITATEDRNLSFHRFPLGGTPVTMLKARVWAEYCFPTGEWSTEKSLKGLHSQNKVLCSKHFDDSSFTNSARMTKCAIPIGTQDLMVKFRQEQCATTSGSEQDTNISVDKPQVLVTMETSLPVQEPTAANPTTSSPVQVPTISKPTAVSPKNITEEVNRKKKTMCDVIELDGEVAIENAKTETIDEATKNTNHSSYSVEKQEIGPLAKTVNTQSINCSTVSKVNELDKFKRRLIRVIARCLLEEKKPEEQIWEDLKKETSCDCKLLWSRMRAVTIKKLRRLFVADDRSENITKIAQLSVTDWLLFDLVLVHENVDVIGQEEQDINKKQKDSKVLEDLFKLVVEYKVEQLRGDELTKAWYDLTQKYNSCGRKCSPMLLQRRWFQLKELVWYNFYNFWFSYRGLARHLNDAIHYKPTILQREVIKRFSNIVTQQFSTWEQLIEEKKVSLLPDFERLQLCSRRRKFAENEPDLVVIEPEVETIDLRLESDSELSNEDPDNASASDSKKANEKTKSQPDITIVKTETINDVNDADDDVRILEDVHIPLENLELTVNRPSSDDEIFLSDYSLTQTIDHIGKTNSESNQSSDVVITDDVDNTRNKDLSEKIKDNFDHNDDPLIIDYDYSNIKKIENNKETEQLGDRQLIVPTITNTVLEHKTVIDDHTFDETNEILEEVIKRITKNKSNAVSTGDTIEVAKANLPININKNSSKLEKNGGLKVENDYLNFAPLIDFLELEDDGIEYVEEDDDMTENVTKTNVRGQNEESYTADHIENNAPTIDPKLLLDPVVYTKRLDDMDVFRSMNYETVKDESIIKKALLESSPVDKKSTNMVGILEESEMSFENNSLSHESLNSCDCQDRVSIKSWYFQKPKIASYNPIQLCKNPDFNTRLKRLTAGFFSSERNRRLLKECKPLTIDVHKSFEVKLTNNSLLVDGFQSRVADRRESIKTFDDTVIPSVPVETLTETRISSPGSVSYNSSNHTENILPNSELNQMLPKSFTSNRSNAMKPSIERSKVINLPDINEIRCTNEKLLIAEVIPIQCESNKSQLLDSVNINNKSEKSVPDSLEITDKRNAFNKLIMTSNNSDPKSQPDLEKMANESGQFEKPGDQIKRKLTFKLKTTHKKKVASPPPSSTTTQPKITEFVRKGMPVDRLLALDTVERILKVCQGQEMISKKKLKYTIKASANPNEAKCVGQSSHYTWRASENSNNVNDVTDVVIEQCIINTPSVVAPHKVAADKQNSQSKRKNTKRKIRRRKQKYCCWANRQIKFLRERKISFRAHTCLESNCMCCCKEDYKQELEIMKNIKIKRIKTTVDSRDNVHSVEKEDAFQKTMSVAEDINITDPEFVSNQNLYTNPETCHKINENMETSDTCKLINISNYNQPQASVLTEEVSYTNDSFTEGLNPNITNVQSLSEPIATTSQVQDKNNTNKMKCKTNVVFSLGPSYLTSPIKPTTPILETSKNFNLLIPESKDCLKNDECLFNDKSEILIPETPLSLGKNKMLLSSVKPTEEVEKSVEEQIVPHEIINHDVLPPDVHLTLIANNELVFSIDPGVELDSTTLSNLPTIMSAVQEELNSLQGKAAIESMTNNYCPNIFAVPDNLENINQDNTNINVETSVAVDNLKADVFGAEDTSNFVECVVKCVTGSSEEVTNAVNENIVLSEESNLVDELQWDSKQIVNNDEPTNQSQKNEENVVSKITQDSAKKTILSDLMEMSGISLEDTSIVSVQKDSVKDITETNILESRPLVNLTLNRLLSKKFGSVINNVTNTVNRAICPKLNKVSTIGGLQYAFNNRGKFFKMDVETGTITPITVKIRRKLVQKFKPTVSKTVIDLTDDGDNEEQELSKNNLKQRKISIEPPKAIKPVRLLKAINPAILKRSGKSILITQEGNLDAKYKKKNVVYIVKRKRKQDSNIGKNVESILCSSSESDDEPLALKAKRSKGNDEIEAAQEPEDKSQGGNACENQTVVDNSFEDDVNPEALTEEEPVDNVMNTVLESVAFNDSSDEDCILGV